MKSLRAILPAADSEGTRVRFQIEIMIGIAERRQPHVEGKLLLGQEILMLDNAGGNRNASQGPHFLRPQSRAVHQDIATDRATIGDNADGAAAIDGNLLNENALLDPG